jgi:hypothetical protein
MAKGKWDENGMGDLSGFCAWLHNVYSRSLFIAAENL